MSLINGSEGTGQSASTPTQSTGNPAAVMSSQAQSEAAPKQTWRDSLPEDLKKNSYLSNFSDIESLAKSYINAQSMIGKKGVIVPNDQAAPEEWNEFYKKIGRPDLEKFDIEKPEGAELDDEFLNSFKKTAYETGLMPKQANALLKYMHDSKQAEQKKTLEVLEAEQSGQIEALRKEWGDGWNKNIALAKFAAKEAGLMQYLEETGLGNDVTLIKGLVTFAKKYMGEHKITGDGKVNFGKTPKEISDEHAEIQSKLFQTDRSKNPNEYDLLQKKLIELAKMKWSE